MEHLKILKKSHTFNEFDIQLEEWTWDTMPTEYVIGAYPKGNWRSRFRAWISFDNFKTANQTFFKLETGLISVLDLDFVTMTSGGRQVPMKSKLKHNDD